MLLQFLLTVDWACVLGLDQVGGYRDLMLCVVVNGGGGLLIVGEIQIQDTALHTLKLKVSSHMQTIHAPHFTCGSTA